MDCANSTDFDAHEWEEMGHETVGNEVVETHGCACGCTLRTYYERTGRDLLGPDESLMARE